jgi:hypothetical protein
MGTSILQCEVIKQAVHRYNDQQTFRNDLALAAALEATRNTLPPSLGRFVAEVCTVADWGFFELRFFSFTDRLSTAQEIEICWPLLNSMQGKEEVATLALDALSYTRLLRPTKDSDRQLSFLSKYLHSCINPVFPIWDENSRLAVNFRKMPTNKDKALEDAETWKYYVEWVLLVRQLVAEL